MSELDGIRLTTDLGPSETEDAKQFWRQTELMGKSYGARPPEYALKIARLIAAGQPESVFEFGCNAGRNLEQLRTLLPSARLAGVDINAASIRFGRSRGFDIWVGDERILAGFPDNSWDLTFTISVLDHVPDHRPIANELLRVSRKYMLLYEPCVRGRVGKIEEPERASDDRRVVPYSYLHNYYELGDTSDARLLLDESIPVKPTGVGPYYRAMLFSKVSVDAEPFHRALTE